MPTSPFFNNFAASQEQQLLDDLIVESIRVYGLDMYYVPRTVNNLDKLYTTDDQSSYESAHLVEIYIKSVDGFTGDGDFLSKFGLQIRDQVVFSIARRTFDTWVGKPLNLTRPREGDLIYFPLNDKLFQIKYVNKFEMFYQLGSLQTWEVTCELFEYSNESFSTGVTNIDKIQNTLSTNILDYALRTPAGDVLVDENGNPIVNEKYNLDTILGTGANESVSNTAVDFIDWTQEDPFTEFYEER